MSTTTTVPARWTRNFFPFWTGQAFSLLGSQLVQFALIWWLTVKTGSATVLAFASLVGMLPQVLLGPVAGALVDRWNRKIVMLVADGSIAIATGILIYLFWIGDTQIWHVYVVMFYRAAAGAFHYPAMTASTSLMVPEKQLARIAGLNETLRGVLTVAAPPFGAFLVSAFPIYQILWVDVLTAALAVGILTLVRVPQPAAQPVVIQGEKALVTLGRDLKAGLDYVLGWPGLLGVLVIAVLINLLVTPAMTLLPVLVTGHFHGGAYQIGLLESAWGGGLIGGGLALGLWGGSKRRIVTCLLGLIGMGIGLMVIGMAPESGYWIGFAGVAFTGLMNPIMNGPLNAIIQAKIAPEMQGRVFSLIGALATASGPLGLAVAGPVSDWIGVSTWLVFGGLITVLLGIGAFFTPVILRIEEHPSQNQSTGDKPVPNPVSDPTK